MRRGGGGCESGTVAGGIMVSRVRWDRRALYVGCGVGEVRVLERILELGGALPFERVEGLGLGLGA